MYLPLQFSNTATEWFLTLDGEKELCTRRSYPRGGTRSTEPPKRGEKGSVVLDSSVDRRHRRELSEGRNLSNVHKKHLKDRVSGGWRLAPSPPSPMTGSQTRKSLRPGWNNHRQPHTQRHMQTEVTKRKTLGLSPQIIFHKPFQKNNVSPGVVIDIVVTTVNTSLYT